MRKSNSRTSLLPKTTRREDNNINYHSIDHQKNDENHNNNNRRFLKLHQQQQHDSTSAYRNLGTSRKTLPNQFSSHKILARKGTSMRDMRRRIDFTQEGKRFITVGLNFECRIFSTCRELFHYLLILPPTKQKLVDTRLRRKSIVDSHGLMTHDDNSSSLRRGSHGTKVRVQPHASATEIPHFKQPVWIDVQSPSVHDIMDMQQAFHIHPLTTEDILSKDTFEKWESYTNYMYIVFVGPVEETNLLQTSFHAGSFVQKREEANTAAPPFWHKRRRKETLIHILVFDSFVITVHDRPIKGLDLLMRRIETEFELDIMHQSHNSSVVKDKYDFERLRTKTPQPQNSHLYQYFAESSLGGSQREYCNVLSLGACTPMTPASDANNDTACPSPLVNRRRRTHIPSTDWILYAFLDVLVDLYIPNVEALHSEVDVLDEAVYMVKKRDNPDLLNRIGLATRNIANLKRLLIPKYSMTTFLISRTDEVLLTQNVRIYLRDVLDHLRQCIEKLEVARKNITQTHANYVTKFQLDIAKMSKKTQSLTNQITVFAALWGPVSLISGFFGMNTKVPGQAKSGRSVGELNWFFGLVTFLAILTLIVAIYFRKELISEVEEKNKIFNEMKSLEQFKWPIKDVDQ